ncbi:globin [Marinobacter nanhaiticus D15-8W]|uniref:Globin n=1 Tax=Marinobacter nanhaiticus D15-8W TaxID=626887 RepID=N6VXA1_9GAMM|nr:globin [Marinobacter nanhaiticus]ENO14880.1 globin [Marinobacter nanhaiticus D15-8W]BES69424.1 globin [Marinobacter nanhaiticus D15-8W]
MRSVASKDSDIVFQSYGRCCNNEIFFIDFYDRFMSSSPAIFERFRETDMKQQRHLLRNGIMQLVLYSRGMSDAKLRSLGKSHDRHGYNIRPEWYELWIEALIATLREHDPVFSPEVETAWRRAIAPGVELIRGAY